jgi:hypothetical protein
MPAPADEQELWCEVGNHHWTRPPTRGRPPLSCPHHAATANSQQVRRPARQPGGRWLGELRTCFLLEDGWAFRFEINRFHLRGRAGSWKPPLAFAEALGIADGESLFFEPAEPFGSEEVALSRTQGKCLGGPIDAPLHALGAAEGDIAFLSVRSGAYTLRLRRLSELTDDDALGRLLWSCGLDPGDETTRSAPWARLTRALGGTGTTREDCRMALLRRGDESLRALLEELDRGVARAPTQPWPEGWAARMPMSHDRSTLTLLGTDGSVRVALGVIDTSGQPPRGFTVSDGGLVWIHHHVAVEPDELAGILREAPRGLVPGAHKSTWVRWLRAEHAARRAALLGTGWEIWRTHDAWWIGAEPHPDLSSALETTAVETDEVPPAPATAPTRPYPRGAVAFSRALDDATRQGLESLGGHQLHGFVATYSTGRELTGAGLMDVLR